MSFEHQWLVLQKEMLCFYTSGAHTLEWGCSWGKRVLSDMVKAIS